MDQRNIRGAEVVVPCTDLDTGLSQLRSLGFRLESIFPADGPEIVVVIGHGVRLRLDRNVTGPAPTVRLVCGEPAAVAGGARQLTLPGGARLELVQEGEEAALPPLVPAYTVSRASRGDSWRAGRAGMQYRDLMADRQGGRFLASLIRIPTGGPVPDYVHYHNTRFQMIYCRRGWVRGLYEDQGEPFLMVEGDCVLQPPRVRHRVLECSAGLEVLELGSPARYETRADYEIELPSPVREREYDGQRFVHHHAAQARWERSARPGWLARDLELAAASAGIGRAHVLRAAEPGVRYADTPGGEILWGCVLRGAVTLDREHRLEETDAFTIPAGRAFELTESTADFEWLVVTVG